MRLSVVLVVVITLIAGLASEPAVARPGVLERSHGHVPDVLRASASDGKHSGYNVQDGLGRTVRAISDPWNLFASPSRSFVLRRYLASGAFDPAFARRGRTHRLFFGRHGEDWTFTSPLLGDDSRIALIGSLAADSPYNNSSGIEIRMFNSSGSPDRGFSYDGVYRRTVKNSSKRDRFELRDATFDAHGNVWLCGKSSGTGRESSAEAFAIAADGRGEVPGSRMSFGVAPDRFTSCGGIFRDRDGSILAVAADHQKIEVLRKSEVSGLTSALPSIDIIQTLGEKRQEIRIDGVTTDAQGRILIRARLATEQTPAKTRVWRLESTGELDLGFGIDGTASVPFLAPGIWPQADGKILLGGFVETTRNREFGTTPMLVRLGIDGKTDPEWAGGHILKVPRLNAGFEQQLILRGRHYFGPTARWSGKQPPAHFQRISLK